jgi:type IV pilus assembly protein PilM
MNALEKFFPVPEYMAMPAVGLDISDQSVRFLELERKGNYFSVGRYGEKKVPKGIMEGGKLKDVAGMKEVLRTIQKEQNFSFVNVSLSEEEAYLFRMKVPPVKLRELRGSIDLQIENYVPLKASEVVFDYEIIHEDESGYDVEVSALPKGVAQDYFDLFNETNLTPLVFEIEAQAIARSVIKRRDKETYMVVDFGETRTGISVVSEGVLMFTSTLDAVGGHSLNEAIEKNFKVTSEEAETMKREQGIRKTIGKNDLFQALIGPISVLRDEINRHYVYWHTYKEEGKKDREKIEKVILCGGDGNLLGITDYLSASLKLPVVRADIWANVDYREGFVPEIEFNDSLRYATAVGLALGGFWGHD